MILNNCSVFSIFQFSDPISSNQPMSNRTRHHPLYGRTLTQADWPTLSLGQSPELWWLEMDYGQHIILIDFGNHLSCLSSILGTSERTTQTWDRLEKKRFVDGFPKIFLWTHGGKPWSPWTSWRLTLPLIIWYIKIPKEQEDSNLSTLETP